MDGAIHRAASRSLKEECRSLGGCREGETKLTGGHRLPAKCKLLCWYGVCNASVYRYSTHCGSHEQEQRHTY